MSIKSSLDSLRSIDINDLDLNNVGSWPGAVKFIAGLLLFIFHRKVKTTGFQPVSFSATMRGWRASAWITDTAVIRSTRSSITLFG